MKSGVCILAVALCLVGCGGSNSGTPVNSSGNSVVSGTWKLTLNENQAQIVATKHNPAQTVDANPTAIAISLTQSDAFLSLAPSTTIYDGNVGCDNNNNWWNLTLTSGPGNWEYGTYSFDFVSGQVSGKTVNLVLNERMGANDTSSAHGPLTFQGTVQTDGSISGTVADSCILTQSGQPTSVSFKATRISTFPPIAWP